MLTKTYSIRNAVRKADDATGLVIALVNGTELVDLQGDRVRAGAFAPFIAQAQATGKWPISTLNHLVGQGGEKPVVVGRWLGAEELLPGDARLPADFLANRWGALAATIQFQLATQDGRDAFANVKGNFLTDWSIMFLPEVAVPVSARDRVAPEHRQDILAIRTLLEGGPVVVGASVTLTVGAKGSRRNATRMPTAAELAIAQMAVDAGKVAAAKALHGSWYRAHVDRDVLERAGR